MKLTILTDIPPEFNVARIMAKPGLADFAETMGGIDSLLDQARRTGKPKACFAISVIGEKGGNYIAINGEMFESRILRVNIEGIDSAALFVATCGVELQEWAESFSDFLMRFLAEEICEEALRISIDFLEKKIDALLGGKNLSTMNPGSLEDWPLVEQKPLFRALGDVTGAIGVKLTESCLMLPRKSVSGIRFSSPQPFCDCLLCPREDCPGRQANFDPHLFEIKYSGARHGGLYPEGCDQGRMVNQ
jgi:hypothetical protein